MTIAVTEDVYRKGFSVFSKETALEIIPAPAGDEALAECIHRSRARHAVVGVHPYRGPIYDALPRGGVLARFGVGHDGIDKEKATERGILCTNTPGTLDVSVAELTMGLILALARGIVPAARNMCEGAWKPELGMELRGKKLAVIGCGLIGSRVAAMAVNGFGMTVTGCTSRAFTNTVPPPPFAAITNSFAEAVAEASFVSLHIPATPANRKFLNAERLAMIPREGFVINTSRGSVLDEPALYDALVEGALAGAALDVFEAEPYVPQDGKDLRELPNVLLSPHAGSTTVEASSRMAERALQNILAAEQKRFHLMDLLNPMVLRIHESGAGQ